MPRATSSELCACRAAVSGCVAHLEHGHAAGMLLPVDGDGLVPPLGSQTALASGARKAVQDPVVWNLRSAASASWVRYLSPPGLLPCSWTTTRAVPIRTSTLSHSSGPESDVVLQLT